MPNDSSSSFFSSFSPQQLLAVFTLVSSTVLLQLQPLQSRREVDRLEPASMAGDDYKFLCSPIEDPLQACKAQSVVRSDGTTFDRSKQVRAFSHWEFFSKQLVPEATKAELTYKPVQVICALLRPGMETLAREQRHRTRLAVISALSAMGYVPDASQCMQVCRLFNGAATRPRAYVGEWNLMGRDIDVPFEWFRPSPSLSSVTGQEGGRFNSICVMWMDSEAVLGRDDRPVERLRCILHTLLAGYPRLVSDQKAPEVKPEMLETAILGPYDSTSLTSMVREALEVDSDKRKTKKPHRWSGSLHLASPMATASAETLIHAAENRSHRNSLSTAKAEIRLQELMDQLLAGSDGQSKRRLFFRSPVTDDHVAISMVEELRARNLKLPTGSKQNDAVQGDIVLVSEFDTAYGRDLPLRFLAAADVPQHASVLNQAGSRWHWVSYPRGLDGRFSAAAPDKGNAKAGEEKKPVPGEALRDRNEPAGNNQIDSLRRLAAQLQDLHEQRRRRGMPGIVAVGVLGWDVYDKLLVIRALRPLLDDTIFFTNNLDAWLWDADELHTTRHLIVGSPFDLHLGARWQAGKPPFRDSYQTSAYAATLALLAGSGEKKFRAHFWEPGVLEKDGKPDERRRARMFEIGRDGPVPLAHSVEIQVTDGLHPSIVKRTFFLDGVWDWAVLGGMAALCAMAIAIWLVVSSHQARSIIGRHMESSPLEPSKWKVWKVTKNLGSKLKESLRQLRRDPHERCKLARNEGLPLVLTLVLLLGSFLIWRWQNGFGEPVSLRNGTSSWFYFSISLVAVVLGLHLAAKSLAILWLGEDYLRETYFSGAPVGERRGWRERLIVEVLLAWPSEGIIQKGEKGENELLPGQLWRAFHSSGRLTPRLVRAGFNTLLIMGGMLLVSLLEPLHFMPVRGVWAHWMCGVMEFVPIAVFVGLSMLVFDALWLNRIFIDWFGRGITTWPKNTLKLKQVPGLDHQHLSDHTDLVLIADWTRDIGRLTALPFCVLALLMLARLNYFDRWAWQWHMLAAVGVAAIMVILGSYSVHRAAMRLRRETLAHLEKDHRSLNDSAPVCQLMAKIQQLSHGAFTPFLKQPVMEAVYWLVSALSVTGLWQAISQMLA